jgi:anti-sigma regulatory factor (Ser/Thr protein kinase)
MTMVEANERTDVVGRRVDGPRPASLVAAFRDASCLPGLRAWLREQLAPTDTLLDAELVCTELVTNAVEHAGGPRRVRVTVLDRVRMRIEVDDTGAGAPLTVGESRLGEHRGRGLTIVNAVAHWGVRRTRTGKTVWATLELA